MSKWQYSREIEKEIRHINEIIDFKILHGFQYRDETRRHRKLLRELKNLKQTKPISRFFSLLF